MLLRSLEQDYNSSRQHMHTDLSVVIVSYNTKNLLKSCLVSIIQSSKAPSLDTRVEIIVVDNASTDGSLEMVKKNYPAVRVIENKTNKGFSGANNQGMHKAKGQYILLLNSDTRVTHSFFQELDVVMKEYKEAGVIGCRLLNPDGSLQQSFGYFPSLIRIFLWMSFFDDVPFISKFIPSYHVRNAYWYTKAQRVDWVSGACMLVSKRILAKAGEFDERYFMYGEEVEWSFRIKKAGFAIIYTPVPFLYHDKGASGKGKTSGIVEEFDSILRFYQIHKPVWQLITVRLFLQYGALLRLIVFGIISPSSGLKHTYAKAFSVARR